MKSADKVIMIFNVPGRLGHCVCVTGTTEIADLHSPEQAKREAFLNICISRAVIFRTIDECRRQAIVTNERSVSQNCEIVEVRLNRHCQLFSEQTDAVETTPEALALLADPFCFEDPYGWGPYTSHH